MKEDEKRTFESTDDGYIFTSKVNYPNNETLVKQNVYLNKDSKVTKVEVTDKDNSVLISMNYNKIEYDKKFDKDYFELNSIIKVKEETTPKKDTNNNNANNSTSQDKDIPNSNNNSGTTTNSGATSSSSGTTNNTNTNQNESNATKEETKTTLSIKDVIYPMYLPDNTYLTGQERINTENGERLILTFGGDNSFVLVEETINTTDNNLVIPVSGDFDFLSDVIGVIGNNSVMWHSNGIEYYMTSNTLETSVLVEIARSISILPVSK